MFCSECGKQATGKFCWNCGAALHGGDAADHLPVVPPVPVPPPLPALNWRDEVDYAVILRNPAVRDILAKQKPPASRLTGEQFAASFEKIVASPISLVPAMAIMQDVYGRLGIHTGKTRNQTYARPAGGTIVAVLCGLAQAGYKVKDVQQASDGCMLICELPSDLFSLAGQLLITIQKSPGGSSVDASTHIEGQLYDWGKSNRCLNSLFATLEI